MRPDGDDGHELFIRGEAPDPVRHPVYEIAVRVALAAPAGRGAPTAEAQEETPRWSGCLPADRRRGAKGRGGSMEGSGMERRPPTARRAGAQGIVQA